MGTYRVLVICLNPESDIYVYDHIFQLRFKY